MSGDISKCSAFEVILSWTLSEKRMEKLFRCLKAQGEA
jgi:hypothetical protein